MPSAIVRAGGGDAGAAWLRWRSACGEEKRKARWKVCALVTRLGGDWLALKASETFGGEQGKLGRDWEGRGGLRRLAFGRKMPGQKSFGD